MSRKEFLVGFTNAQGPLSILEARVWIKPKMPIQKAGETHKSNREFQMLGDSP